jgi:uncharacterized protein YcgL (UPF0745 family)
MKVVLCTRVHSKLEIQFGHPKFVQLLPLSKKKQTSCADALLVYGFEKLTFE